MMLGIWILAALGQASAPPPAPPLFTANALKQRCEQTETIASCFAFISGVHETSRAYQAWMNFREFCAAETISQGELRDATLRYLNLHPSQGDAQAASIVILALRERYPCPVAPAAPAAPPVPPTAGPQATEVKPASPPQ